MTVFRLGRATVPLVVGAAAVGLVAGPVAAGPVAADAASMPLAAARTAPSTAAPAAAGRVVSAATFGMHVSNVQGGTWPTTTVGSVRLWDTQTAWSQVERRRGRYSWAALDTAVSTARSHGAGVLLVLGSTPTWAASRRHPGYDYPVAGAASPPRDLRWWDTWVTKVATRYKGRIGAYQVWNEASLLNFWNGTPAQMADLTARAHRIIKRIDPQATVVAASTTTRLAGSYQRFFPAYLAALRARGWPVDVFAGHFYPPGTGTPADRARLIGMLKRDLARYRAPSRPLWDTESNFGLAGPGSIPGRSISGGRAAAWYAAAMMDSVRLGVARTYWYAWTPPYPLLGIQMHAGAPAAVALRVTSGWLVGARFLGCTGSSRYVCTFQRGTARATIAYTAGPTRSYTVPTGASRTCNALGRCSRVRPGQTMTVTASPRWFGR